MFLKRKNDRRRSKRQFLNTSVRVFTHSACLEALGITINEHGMRLFTLAHLPVDSQINLEFLAPWSKNRLRVSGTVRHRALYLYGIEFSPDSDQISSGWEGKSSITEHSQPVDTATEI